MNSEGCIFDWCSLNSIKIDISVVHGYIFLFLQLSSMIKYAADGGEQRNIMVANQRGWVRNNLLTPRYDYNPIFLYLRDKQWLS